MTSTVERAPREPAPAAAATMTGRVSSEDRVPGTLRKPVHLDRGSMLRIVDGQGTQLVPASGVIWITEEQSANDTVLLSGETHRLEKKGLTLVLAHRAARLLLKVPAGTLPPRRVDLVQVEGEPGRRIPFGMSRRFSLRALMTRIRVVIRRTAAAGRKLWTQREALLPAGGWLEHDTVYSSWRVSHARGGRGMRATGDPLWSARDAISRDYPIHYY
ncbi:MAG TPA: DUF2917 domain-containing protein [Casimicrobiaceae bacterium]|nr:DUF2917 domain-containing protein [Casimicrobiaceae bacterium]